MDSFSNPQPTDRRMVGTLNPANDNHLTMAGAKDQTMSDAQSTLQAMQSSAETNGTGEIRPQVPTWSVANAKDAKPTILSPTTEPEAPKPEVKGDNEPSNGSAAASGDADAQSDIDELLTGGDAEPEPPRYDGDFDIERHDYWWNLLDLDNPRHARASKGMRYGAERNPRCDTCERQNRACMTRPNSHDKTGCVRCSYTQSGCSHAREARESHQQRTGFPPVSSKSGSARKRDDMDEDGSRSPAPESVAKRPRLSSYSAVFPEGRGSNATPSRSNYDAPLANGRHYSPHLVPGSAALERERSTLNGESTRPRHEDGRQYYDSHDAPRNEDRYQHHDRYEVPGRELNNLFGLVDKLQREVRTLRSRLDGMETRVNDISGAVDIYRS